MILPLLLVACGTRITPLAELGPELLEVQFYGGDQRGDRFAVDLRLAPPEGCLEGAALTATLDGVDLGEGWIGDTHHGNPAGSSCSWWRWTPARTAVPRGPGDRLLVITDGRTELALRIPDPWSARRLEPTATLDLSPGAEARFALAGGGVLVGPGEAWWAPEGAAPGDDRRVRVPSRLDGAAIGLTVPADLAPGRWRLFVHARVEVPVACPAATCRVHTLGRFAKIVTVD